jgi:hypothetical protein
MEYKLYGSRFSMISNSIELDQSIQQLERMYRALAELRQRVLPQSAANFQVVAEGPIEEIRRLQREIDEYLGIGDAALVESERR